MHHLAFCTGSSRYGTHDMSASRILGRDLLGEGFLLLAFARVTATIWLRTARVDIHVVFLTGSFVIWVFLLHVGNRIGDELHR